MEISKPGFTSLLYEIASQHSAPDRFHEFPITGKNRGNFFVAREKPHGFRFFAKAVSRNRELTGNAKKLTDWVIGELSD